jgi:hypothetical protein
MAKSQDDLNRFLAEIDRLRKKSADGGGSPPPPRAKAVPMARPVSPPPPPPPPVRSKKRIAEDPPPVVPVVAPPPSVPVFVARDTSSMPASTVATIRTIDAAPAVVPVTAIASAAPPSGGEVQRRVRNIGLTSVAALLRDRKALANAFILQTVLGPPKCREQS